MIGINLNITLNIIIIIAAKSMKKNEETYLTATNFLSTTITSLLKYAVLKLTMTSSENRESAK